MDRHSGWENELERSNDSGDPRAPVPALRARLPLPSPPRSLRLRRFLRDPGPAGAAAFRRPRRWGPASLAAFPGESVGIVAARRSQVRSRENWGPRATILHICKSEVRISAAVAGVWTKHYSSASKLPSALLLLPSLFLTWLLGLRDNMPLDFQKLEKEMEIKGKRTKQRVGDLIRPKTKPWKQRASFGPGVPVPEKLLSQGNIEDEDLPPEPTERRSLPLGLTP
ncbi:uncharacterized protein LOC135230893 [Loxodonta africana]|uniref:uncharacterized protein LOC135230893 n=1 Tax=Loxodonta africana TaxID=9785 RepID=UPI0030CE3DA4